MTDSQGRAAVRSAGRAARRAVAGLERVYAERALISHLLSLDAVHNPSIGVFVAHDGEPELTPLVNMLWAQGTTVALPVLANDPDDYSMRFVPWCADDVLEAGRYGIPVPPARAAIEPATVLVSVVGFDGRGDRIGRGGGFFDRYLEKTQAAVVGVGFEVQRFDRLPTESHDVSLPVIVTDLGVRFCTRHGEDRVRVPAIGKDGSWCE